ncbi:heavy-metal-associated domain-containing protein [Rhodococcus aerolatus]
MSTTYTVTGMTCEHCVASVTEEVDELDGASVVSVDLDSGALVVDGDVPRDQIQAAVQEAGYKLVPSA